MKKRTKLIGIATGAVLLILGAGYTLFIAPVRNQEKWVYIEAEVERGTLTVGVTESGSLDYGITSILYDLDLTVNENDSEDEEEDEEETVQKYLKVEEVYVAAGQRIQEGDALLKFTDDSVESVRSLLQSALVDAKTAYNEVESEYELALLEAQTDYDTKIISQKYASEIYREATEAVEDEIASMQTEIQICTANISALEEKVAEAEEDYSDAYKTYQEAEETMSHTGTENAVNFMTIQTAYLNAQTQFRNAENALTQAKENLEKNVSKIATLKLEAEDALARRSIDKLDVEEEYLESMINGDNAEITYHADLESLKEDLQEEEEDREKIEEQLEAFEAFVGEDGILYADGEGIVTEVGYEAGDRLINTGTVVAYATPDDMTIPVDVTQEDVVSLAVGNRVEIQFGAYPNETYEGVIRSINTTATSEESATISYQVVVGVEGDTEALYGGMTADITFVTEEKEDVLYVSRKAIVEQNGKMYVYVGTALGGRELQEVETGIRNSTSVEILSGLEEGDSIYIASRVSSEEVEAESDINANFNKGEKPGAEGGMPNSDSGEMPNFGGNMSGVPEFGDEVSGFGGEMPSPGGEMPGSGGMPNMGTDNRREGR